MILFLWRSSSISDIQDRLSMSLDFSSYGTQTSCFWMYPVTFKRFEIAFESLRMKIRVIFSFSWFHSLHRSWNHWFRNVETFSYTCLVMEHVHFKPFQVDDEFQLHSSFSKKEQKKIEGIKWSQLSKWNTSGRFRKKDHKFGILITIRK